MMLARRLLMGTVQTRLMMTCWQRTCRRLAALHGLPGRGWREAMVQGLMRWCVAMKTQEPWKPHQRSPFQESMMTHMLHLRCP